MEGSRLSCLRHFLCAFPYGALQPNPLTIQNFKDKNFNCFFPTFLQNVLFDSSYAAAPVTPLFTTHSTRMLSFVLRLTHALITPSVLIGRRAEETSPHMSSASSSNARSKQSSKNTSVFTEAGFVVPERKICFLLVMESLKLSLLLLCRFEAATVHGKNGGRLFLEALRSSCASKEVFPA